MRLILAAATIAVFANTATAAPNIIRIQTDDHTMSAISGRDSAGRPFMPFIDSKKNLARRFDRSYFVIPFCAGSRATSSTGMYAHNHGVMSNDAPEGGYYKYMTNGLDALAWPALIKGDYYTAQVGKFQNKYGDPTDNTGLPVIPKGFSDWFALIDPQNMFKWDANKNGTVVHYEGNTDQVYQTDVLAKRAASIIRQKAGVKPFALDVNTFATHSPWQEAKRHEGLYDTEPFHPATKPSYMEADLSDKPDFVRLAPTRTNTDVERWQDFYRRSLASGRAVDDAFRMIWEALEEMGELANTFIIFGADNGFLWLEHSLTGKGAPYQEAIRTWTYVWGPGVMPGLDHTMISNMDFMPTFLEIADKPIPAYVDGRSLMPLLRGENPPRRQVLLIENKRWQNNTDGSMPSGARFLSITTKQWTYTNYQGEIEYYDLQSDPFELNNLAQSLDPARQEMIESRIDALQACVGRAQCQPLEDAPL